MDSTALAMPQPSEGNAVNYIGIDPGKSGALVVITPDGIDLIQSSKATEHDVGQWLAEVDASGPCFAMLEQVHSMPKQGVSSTFKFGQSFGFLRGLLVAHQVPFEMVTPQKWQKELSCRSGGDKNVTKQKAQELFPAYKWTHATADAVLLAEYCRRVKS